MSNQKSGPASGYPTAGMLTDIVKSQTTSLVKRKATEFASHKLNITSNVKLGQAGLLGGLSDSAINKGVESARSASEKLNGVLGGKLSSVLGSGVGDRLGAEATRSITNLKTGAVNKVTTMVQNKLGSALSGTLGASIGGMLGGALGQLSDTAGKNLTGASLVSGFLSTGPKDNLLVTDTYGVSDNGILNNLGDKLTGFAREKFDELRRSPSLVTDLTSMVFSGGKNWSISKDNLIDRVVGTLGGRTGILNGLSDTLRSSLTNGTGLPADIYDTAVMIIRGETRNFNAGDVQSARDMYGLLNQITRGDQLGGFFDIGSESALMSGVMREAIALGVPDAISVLVENAQADEVAYNALYANMLVAVENSDLDTINLMIEKVGVNAFLAQIPNAVPLLLSSYELPVGSNSDDYDTEWEALQTVLASLRPNWHRVQRDGTWVNVLTAYSEVSDDARKLLLREDEHMVATLIGSTYAGRPDVIDELQRMYPLVPLRSAA